MANTKSAKKRIIISKRNQVQNRYYKTSVKNLIKLFFKELENYKKSYNPDNKKKATAILNSIYKFIDKGSKNHVFPKNTAARKKSKLAKRLKNTG